MPVYLEILQTRWYLVIDLVGFLSFWSKCLVWEHVFHTNNQKIYYLTFIAEVFSMVGDIFFSELFFSLCSETNNCIQTKRKLQVVASRSFVPQWPAEFLLDTRRVWLRYGVKNVRCPR
jgi:hypothetical protein